MHSRVRFLVVPALWCTLTSVAPASAHLGSPPPSTVRMALAPPGQGDQRGAPPRLGWQCLGLALLCGLPSVLRSLERFLGGKSGDDEGPEPESAKSGSSGSGSDTTLGDLVAQMAAAQVRLDRLAGQVAELQQAQTALVLRIDELAARVGQPRLLENEQRPAASGQPEPGWPVLDDLSQTAAAHVVDQVVALHGPRADAPEFIRPLVLLRSVARRTLDSLATGQQSELTQALRDLDRALCSPVSADQLATLGPAQGVPWEQVAEWLAEYRSVLTKELARLGLARIRAMPGQGLVADRVERHGTLPAMETTQRDQAGRVANVAPGDGGWELHGKVLKPAQAQVYEYKGTDP